MKGATFSRPTVTDLCFSAVCSCYFLYHINWPQTLMHDTTLHGSVGLFARFLSSTTPSLKDFDAVKIADPIEDPIEDPNLPVSHDEVCHCWSIDAPALQSIVTVAFPGSPNSSRTYPWSSTILPCQCWSCVQGHCLEERTSFSTLGVTFDFGLASFFAANMMCFGSRCPPISNWALKPQHRG